MKEEPRCLACDTPNPRNGHLCIPCLLQRKHTIHPRWTDQAYLDAMQEASRRDGSTPIINAAEARYELRRHTRTERIA